MPAKNDDAQYLKTAVHSSRANPLPQGLWLATRINQRHVNGSLLFMLLNPQRIRIDEFLQERPDRLRQLARLVER